MIITMFSDFKNGFIKSFFLPIFFISSLVTGTIFSSLINNTQMLSEASFPVHFVSNIICFLISFVVFHIIKKAIINQSHMNKKSIYNKIMGLLIGLKKAILIILIIFSITIIIQSRSYANANNAKEILNNIPQGEKIKNSKIFSPICIIILEKSKKIIGEEKIKKMLSLIPNIKWEE